MTVKVDGTTWNAEAVIQSKSEAEFLALHMADADVYKFRTPEQKSESLKLVYSLCVPKPEKKAPKAKPQAEPKADELDAE